MDNAQKTQILGSIGTIGGLYYAFKNKKGFWGYVGFALLGSVIGFQLGRIIYPSDALTVFESANPTQTDAEKKTK
jgi:hypothetical protein